MSVSQGVTVVVSDFAPPQIGGTSSVLYELLRHFPPESLVLATRKMAPDETSDDRVLQVSTIRVSHPWMGPLRAAGMIVDVVRHLKRLRKRPRNIFAVFPSIDFLLVSLGLSRLLDVPVYVYLNDCLEEVAVSRRDIFLTRLAAGAVFGQAAKVYAMSELMERYYKEKGIKTEALPHCIDVSKIRHPNDRADSTSIRIGFAGEVYQTNDSALADLAKAKEILQDKVELHFALGRKSRKSLGKLGVLDSIDSVSTYGTYDELLDFLSTCDILFVPMNFESIFSKDLKTIFPTKVTDYWLAQRPILVYGPKEYAFVSKAVEDGYAVAVTKKGPEGLAAAITNIMNSPELRSALVSRSEKMIEEHDSIRISKKLMSDLGINNS
jgi:glycosyltransferase involved in cell wall biosynthesis